MKLLQHCIRRIHREFEVISRSYCFLLLLLLFVCLNVQLGLLFLQSGCCQWWVPHCVLVGIVHRQWLQAITIHLGEIYYQFKTSHCPSWLQLCWNLTNKYFTGKSLTALVWGNCQLASLWALIGDLNYVSLNFHLKGLLFIGKKKKRNLSTLVATKQTQMKDTS